MHPYTHTHTHVHIHPHAHLHHHPHTTHLYNHLQVYIFSPIHPHVPPTSPCTSTSASLYTNTEVLASNKPDPAEQAKRAAEYSKLVKEMQAELDKIGEAAGRAADDIQKQIDTIKEADVCCCCCGVGGVRGGVLGKGRKLMYVVVVVVVYCCITSCTVPHNPCMLANTCWK